MNIHLFSLPSTYCVVLCCVSGNRDQIQEVVNVGLIPPLVQILATAEFDIKKEAAWAISNATSGGSPQQVSQTVTDSLTACHAHSSVDSCNGPACVLCCVGMCLCVCVMQVEYLVQCGCIKPLCDLLEVNDTKIVSVALEALENILR